MNRFFCVIVIVLLTSACSVAQQSDWILFNAELKPSLFFEEENDDLALFFSLNFEKLTGYTTVITEFESKIDQPTIVFKKDNDLSYLAFRMVQKDNSLIFYASSEEGWKRAVVYFFIHELKKYPIERTNQEKLKDIKLPLDFRKNFNAPIFEYRAPYFKETYAEGFKNFHMVDVIENDWGIWGHNISKTITITEEMKATVNGELNKAQLCFSSSALEIELIDFIQANSIDNPEQSKFMIMPEDNNMVCTCDQCIQVGNTKSDASPAVFTLVNKLAKVFPAYHFFSTAYISTRNTPSFNLEENTGIMLSTMDYPKGVVLENSIFKNRVLSDIQKWKSITNNIYIWDYVIHFDNYFSTYPTILITQKNLQWYAKNGITGVFLHGTEEMFAAFSPLKAFVYSQLLQNPFLDVYTLIKTYLTEMYPTTFDIILDYYMACEKKALNNNLQLDFYGGWNQDKRKYLNEGSLWKFVEKLEEKSVEASHEEQLLLSEMFTVLYYQQLELARINGINKFGYLEPTKKPNSWEVKDDVLKLLVKWKELVRKHNVKHLNESLHSVTAYHINWGKLIMGKNYINELAGKHLKVHSAFDEEYSDVSMLTDGAFGFNDYFNNWVIFSGKTFEVSFNNESEKEENYELTISFFHQPRHRIHLPQEIIVEVNGKQFNFDVNKKTEKAHLARHVETIYLNIPEKANIKIILTKQKPFMNLAIAVDEIKWNRIN